MYLGSSNFPSLRGHKVLAFRRRAGHLGIYFIPHGSKYASSKMKTGSVSGFLSKYTALESPEPFHLPGSGICCRIQAVTRAASGVLGLIILGPPVYCSWFGECWTEGFWCSSFAIEFEDRVLDEGSGF